MKLILFPFLFISNLVFAINVNISGIVNRYAPVTAITSNTITIGIVSPAHTFVCGDRVMIIQMKGADINITNSANFGDVIDINNAGNYEMATVTNVSGSTITFSENLIKSYTIAGLVQAIYVPHYEDATVTAKLTAQAWNGATGGVLAIEVDGTLTLNNNIDVSGLGFRGGVANAAGTVGASCKLFGNPYNGCVGIEYLYDSGSNQAVEKGEGVALFNNTYLKGKGKNANGGGGGGLESGGGGGGSNFGTGGVGGACNTKSCKSGFGCSCPNLGADVAGLGGLSLTYTDKLYLGGGGGAGSNGNSITHYAENNRNGMKGGGIIVISANKIISSSKNISANGQNGVISSTISSMGTGGGGGGGSVHISASSYSGLIVNANGGRGNDSRKQAAVADNTGGAGGGGGGGRVIFNNSSLPSGVTVNTAFGAGGLCYDREGDLKPLPYSGAGGFAGISIFNKSIEGNVYNPFTLNTITSNKTYNVAENRQEFFSNNGAILVGLKSNTNNLGSTTVTTTLGSNGPFASIGCSVDEFYMPRVVTIVPTTQPTTACDVSLYITGTELNDFITFTNAQSTVYKNCWGAVNGINDLMVTVLHSNGSLEALIPTISYISCSDIYKFDVQVNQFSTFYIHSNKGLFAGNLLPVEWLGFDAKYISKDKIELKWATGVEINNDGFYVERSFDGINFESLTWINGQGNYNSKTEYSYIDNIDIYAKNDQVFYRLNQVDYNGEQEYSKIVVLKLEQYNFIGEIYPNPANTVAFLDIINNSNNLVKVSIINTIGKLVQSNTLQTSSEKTKINIELEDLPLGIYTCIVEINGEKTIRKLIKK